MFAQEVKNQTEEISASQLGAYTSYLTHQDGDKYIGGLENLDYKITKVDDYRARPGTHKEVFFIKGGNPDFPERQTAQMYLPDNPAFPMTYVANIYRGNAELQKEVGFVHPPSEAYDQDRLVFLDQKIYLIEDWVDKDNYTLKAVLEFEAEPMKMIKMIKLLQKSPAKMEAMQPHKTLQAYLDAATARQKEYYAKWIQVPANKSFVDNQAAKEKLMSKTITQMSVDWRNSDEYKRIQENNRRADNARKTSMVTIQNNTGKKIYVRSSESGGSSSISAGSSTSMSCTGDIFYMYNNGSNHVSNSDINTKCYTANESCGGTVTVQ